MVVSVMFQFKLNCLCSVCHYLIICLGPPIEVFLAFYLTCFLHGFS